MQALVCKVKSISKSECTIDAAPINGNADMLAVRLRSVVTDDKSGLIIYPAKDSLVLVGLIDNNVNSAYVIACETIESAKLTIDSNEMTLDKDTAKVKWKQVEFNGGKNYGFIKIVELVKKLNKIEQLLRAIILWMNTHVHKANAPMSPVDTPTVQFTQTIADTAKAEIENDKITH